MREGNDEEQRQQQQKQQQQQKHEQEDKMRSENKLAVDVLQKLNLGVEPTEPKGQKGRSHYGGRFSPRHFKKKAWLASKPSIGNLPIVITIGGGLGMDNGMTE
ncbi:hypothetical protein B0I37DRAFT_359131 [Chaetomium sp. MPI-CAGE-AT-0009]|nr:hypothetical protein B0I37DRAFT_359131 [Chaetomium sp. MPI-CAGE-AT-0009]